MLRDWYLASVICAARRRCACVWGWRENGTERRAMSAAGAAATRGLTVRACVRACVRHSTVRRTSNYRRRKKFVVAAGTAPSLTAVDAATAATAATAAAAAAAAGAVSNRRRRANAEDERVTATTAAQDALLSTPMSRCKLTP